MSRRRGRVDDRTPAHFTALHQAATATWIGGLLFLICLALSKHVAEAQALSRRFSPGPDHCGGSARPAQACLALRGHPFSINRNVLWSHGFRQIVPLPAPCSQGLHLHKKTKSRDTTPLMRLRSFSEAESESVAVLLVARSLTSQPPAIDAIVQPSMAEIIQRLIPMPPRLTTPPRRGQVRHQPDSSDRGLESFVPAVHPITSEKRPVGIQSSLAGCFVLYCRPDGGFARAGIACCHWPWFSSAGDFRPADGRRGLQPVGHPILARVHGFRFCSTTGPSSWSLRLVRMESADRSGTLHEPHWCFRSYARFRSHPLTHTHSLNNRRRIVC